MLRVVEELVERALLDDPPGVHDDDPVGDVGDDAEVVRDEDDPGAALLAQAPQLVAGSAPGSSRRARSSARRRSAGSASRRAPSRSSRAGACRRRTRAGRSAARSRARGMPTRSISSTARARGRVLGDLVVVHADLLDDLVADPVDRVERAHRVLEDHRDPRAADRARSCVVGRAPSSSRRPSKRRAPLEASRWASASGPSASSRSPTCPSRTRRRSRRPRRGPTVNETPSTACTTPSSVRKRDAQVLDLEQRRVGGAHQLSRIRGSSTA